MTYVSWGRGLDGRRHVQRTQVDDGLAHRHHERVAQQHLGAVLVQQGDVLGYGLVRLDVRRPRWPGPVVPCGVSYTRELAVVARIGVAHHERGQVQVVLAPVEFDCDAGT